MREQFTVTSFNECLGTRFRLHYGSASPLEAELIEVAPLPSRPAPKGVDRREPFSLVFRAAGTSHLPQKIYQVEHEKLGTFDLFLVPIGPDQEGMTYQAIFN
jgi:hypothetical protein